MVENLKILYINNKTTIKIYVKMKLKFKNGGTMKFQPGGSVWNQISNPRQTYTDGYGVERPVNESKAITIGRNIYNTLDKFFNGPSEEWYEERGMNKPIMGFPPLPAKTSMNVFEGIEGPLVKGNFGTGIKYNAGKQMLETEKVANDVLKKYDEATRLNNLSLKWTGKKYNDLSTSEQYWLRLLKK